MSRPINNNRYTTEELESLSTANKSTVANDGPWWKGQPILGDKIGDDGASYVPLGPDGVPLRTACDKFSFVLFVFFSTCALVAAAISLGAGAYWVHALKGRPMADCFIIMLTAALPLALGCFIIALIIGIIIFSNCFCILPQAALSGAYRTCCHKTARVCCLHIVPFFCIILGAAGSFAALYFSSMAHQQPDLNESFTSVDGLDGPIIISRDVNGLVHIQARSRADALFGQGLAHGQDRLWQVEFQRLLGRGRLGEFVGAAGAKMDKQIRTLGFPNGAKNMCENASPENKILAQRYVDGLNFYVDHYSQRPAEFLFMGTNWVTPHKVEPFEPMDSCLIAMLLMWQTGANIPTEIQRFKVFWNTNRNFDEVNELYNNFTNISNPILSAEQLGFSEEDAINARAREARDDALERELYDGLMSQLRDQYNPVRFAPTVAVAADSSVSRAMREQQQQQDSDVASSSYSSSSSCLNKILRGDDGDANKQSSIANADEALRAMFGGYIKEFDLLSTNVRHASNSWAGRGAAGGSSMTPQSAMGASDPHLAINVPSVWYWSHMTYPATPNGSDLYDAAGVGLPGLPGVHIGKTSFASWGITMSMTDLGDLYLIQRDPQAPSTHYIVNNASLPFSFRTEVIPVKGGDTITLTIAETIYGPISTEALGLPTALDFAVRADFLRNDTSSFDGLLCLNDPTTATAMDVRDNCLSRIRSPGFSIPIEDVAGNIAYSMTGLHPHRVPGHTGRYPTVGNGSYDYLGMIPFTELPTLTIPAAVSDVSGGHISAANQKTYADGYKYSLGYDFCYPYRGGRLHEVLRSVDPNVTGPDGLSGIDFHTKLQRDVRSNIANDWLGAILNASFYTQSPPTAASQPFGGAVPDEVAAFHATLSSSDNAAAVKAFAMLSNDWDKLMTIGNTEGTLFWKWWRLLMAVPTDAIAALNKGSEKDADDQSSYWTNMNEQYPIKMIQSPTPLMTLQCQRFLQSSSVTGCGQLAAILFINTVNAFNNASGNVWGVDYNQLTTKHLMLDGTVLGCLFERTIEKDGDGSTIDVSDFSLDKRMSSSFASSMRQIYDWSDPNAIHFMFPGGESGNPFSEFFQNFLIPYQKDEYVRVTAVGPIMEGGAVYQQTLAP